VTIYCKVKRRNDEGRGEREGRGKRREGSGGGIAV